MDKAAILNDASGRETIRLCFVDQHGILRGKTVVAGALESVWDSGIGVPSTLLLKDTSHRTVFPVWTEEVRLGQMSLGGASDVILRPAPGGYVPLPHAPHSALLLCDVTDRAGDAVPVSSTAVLDRATDALAAAGFDALFGLEVEFNIFRTLDPALGHAQATMPPAAPLTENLGQGHQYLTETRYAEAEEILDAIRRAAEAMGLEPRTVEVEMGPSQFEFTFAPADAATQAMRYVLFRTMVRELCQSRGLHATFMPRPRLPNAAANGWHIHQSLSANGTNLFAGDALTPQASGWIAGLLAHAAACCLLTGPTVNSYKRFAPFQLAPTRILWGRDNRGAMLRALLGEEGPASRIENRVADPSANPYFALAAQIHAGLAGIRTGATAPEPSENPYTDTGAALPATLGDAIAAFETSGFIADAFGAPFRDYLVTLKRAEWDRYLGTISEWEHQEYFGLL